jgi:diguanylate cyclase (GGDEF)-like protein
VSTIHLILPDQLADIQAVTSTLVSAADVEAGCRLLTDGIAAALGVPVAMLEKRAGTWRIVCSHGEVSSVKMLSTIWELSRPANRRDLVREGSTPDRADWTCLSVGRAADQPRILALGGDWTLSTPLLVQLARRMAAALRRLVSRPLPSVDRRASSVFAFARRLARATDVTWTHQFVINTCARGVNADKGSLALYDSGTAALGIRATYGYPVSLVRHMRFHPGGGIIGSVFKARRPLRVDDLRNVATVTPRLRYRTPAFMSVPLFGAGGPLGVVSVADRGDGRPFSDADFVTLRGFANVAALALERLAASRDAQELGRAAAEDPLTGLFNRRHFLSRLDEEVERARRQRSALVAMMIDVDNFKELNDHLGHPVGDAVLRVVGDALRRSVRVFDVCARLGGDEFAIIMPGSSTASSTQIAERIRQDVDGSRPALGPWSDELRVTASVGIATFEGTTGEDLLARADQALYAAKRAGKNCVRLAGEDAAG